MTQETKFAAGDSVQLRNGLEAKIYEVMPDGEIFGAYRDAQGVWRLWAWEEGGSFKVLDNPRAFDLVHKPKHLTGFVNVYPYSDPCRHPTREKADQEAASNRIACIPLGQFPEGYGLTEGSSDD